jgi:hypothetical protein
MKKLLILLTTYGLTIQSSYAYNNNWVPYALGGLIVGAAIERAYYPPAPRYVVQPQPIFVAAPTYAAPVYAPPPTYAPPAYVPPAQPPYLPQASVLYFCGANGLYYPQTPVCPTSWQVLPNYQ